MENQMVRFLEEFRYVLLLDSQIGGLLEKWGGGVNWEGCLVQIVDLRETPPLRFYMVELIEAPILVLQVGRFLERL